MPPLTIESASALVGGVFPAEKSMQAAKPAAPPSTLRVKVLRQFQDHQRNILAVGSVAELPRIFALEMQAANKCHVVKDEPPPATDAKATEEAPAAEKPRRGKEK